MIKITREQRSCEGGSTNVENSFPHLSVTEQTKQKIKQEMEKIQLFSKLNGMIIRKTQKYIIVEYSGVTNVSEDVL